jgi:Uncharacterized ACR, COG1430
MGIIAETWSLDEGVQLNVHRLTGRHRLSGAIAIGAPRVGEALLFRNCRSLHGWFMGGALDVVFVDHVGRALLVAELAPWCLLSCRHAAHAFELAPGECARLQIAPGARLKIISK